MASSSQRPQSGAFGVLENTPRNLADLAFIATCPPVIQPNTRIIGLCGVTDWRGKVDEAGEAGSSSSSEEEAQPSRSGSSGMQKFLGKGKELLNRANPSKAKRQQQKKKKEPAKMSPAGYASPKSDGWFISDFYLFYHLFRGMGAQQRWLTCESPRDLVDRYTQYAHGDPSRDHRVVLDKNMLPGMREAGNIILCSRQGLLQDFMSYLKGECQAAAENSQPLLLLVFGHGNMKTNGIAIGGTGRSRDAPLLRREPVERLLRGYNINVTLLTSACFSGGWLINPELNISGLTAAGSKTQSWSWKASVGQSFHGSVWATAVMESFIKMEDAKNTQYQPGTTSADFAPLDVDVTSSTFYRLSEVVSAALTFELNSKMIHQVSFAAQDDEWAMEWRQRSGIPLGAFQDKWDALPRKPTQADSGEASQHASGSVSTPRRHGFRSTLTRHQANSFLAELCQEYLSSNPPGNRTAQDRPSFQDARNFLEKGQCDLLESTEELQATLKYRLDAMALATTLKDLTLPAGQTFPPCHEVDVTAWGNAHPQKINVFHNIRSILLDSNILDEPGRLQGHQFHKFSDYLAAAYAESGFDRNAVNAAVETIKTYKARQVAALTERIRCDRMVRNTARTAFSTLGKRLRSPSPQKRGAIPRFSDDIVAR